MLRTIVITLLNIAIPFLIRGLYIFALRLKAKRETKQGMKDVTPPEWHFPVKKLIIIGLLLSLASIAAMRFLNTEIDAPYEGNVTKSEIL